MEKKLELKYIAPYLPYGLKGYASDIQLTDNITLQNVEFIVSEQPRALPILRPLSDLTKEIEHNGERFVPIDRISIYPLSGREYHLLIENLKNGMTEYIVTQMCISWHFDVFGLLESGLAIPLTDKALNP